MDLKQYFKMFNFDFKNTEIFQVARWSFHPFFRFLKIFRNIFLILLIFSFFAFLYGFLTEEFKESFNSFLLGISIILLDLTIIFLLADLFLNSQKRILPKININEVVLNPQNYNIAQLLSFESILAIYKSFKFAKSKKLGEIDSSILFYFILADNPELNFVFFRAVLNLNKIKKLLKQYLDTTLIKFKAFQEKYSKEFENSIIEALKIASQKGHQRIEMGDIIIALAKHDLIFKKILIDSKISIEDVENLIWWQETLKKEVEESKKFWQYKNLIKKGSLAKEFSKGFTLTLDQFSIDWSEEIKKRGFWQVIGHEKETKQLERVLSRTEINNALLVGEPGSGIRSIIFGIAQKAFLGESSSQINYKRVVELDIPKILTQSSSVEEVGLILDTIFQEIIFSENIILLIDQFHNYVGGEVGKLGMIDISGVLGKYLYLPQFQIIAITSYRGLHRYIEQNPSILNLFEKVEVAESTPKETLLILGDLSFNLERKYKKFISYPAIRDIVQYTDRYMPSLPFPKKATDLLDETVIYVVNSTKSPLVLPEHVAKVISEKVEIPIGEIEEKEKEVLLNLEKLIHERIINQDEAVKEVSTALRRSRAEIGARKRPMGSFLFLGPTGVGKTETSKALTEIYFGSEKRMIRLDMSEFQAIKDIDRLIGSAGQEGLLTTEVSENPFSSILLDEIEKAHPNILNLFLQVLDEGYITDGLGRKVSFLDSIIIATSNAGYKIILKALKEKTEWRNVKEELLDYLFEDAIFRPEFINRFDAVVVFKPLSKENLLDIAQLILKKLKKNLEQKAIEFIITEPLKKKIVELSYDPKFGAREMRRVIQDKIENVLASAILADEIKRGDKIEIDSINFEIKKII